MLALLSCALLSASPPPLGRCAPGPADTEARARWKALQGALEARDAAGVKAAWAALEEHPCYRLPFAETWRHPEPDDVELMSQWWEHGGRDWLATGWAEPPNPDFAVVPPDVPKHLTRENAGGLARLLCPAAGPGECGRDAAGWLLRARDRLEPHEDHAGDALRKQAEEECASRAKKAKKDEQYRAWRRCLDEKRPLGVLMPLGRVDAPKDGWLVLRGRRGHYQFCDEVRVYDLATGAAWVAQSCSGLVLQQGGSVDHDATDAQRGVTVKVGRLPVDALREAAWMTLLVPHLTLNAQPWAWFVRRPPGVAPRWPDDLSGEGLGLGSFWVTSAQTQLAWSWQGHDGLRESGSLTWPDSSNAGEDHADDLWRIAEAAFAPGCAPARPPSQLVVGGRPGVWGLDAKPEALQAAERNLLEALFAHDDGCGKAPAAPKK
ncbi:MAG: hypothetical protein AMXMBFR34_51020 [Myxococcaceae bacterium]